MRLRLEYSLTSLVFILILCSLCLYRPAIANATSCKDVKIVFARGSSDNPEGLFLGDPFGDDFRSLESISGSFFKNIQSLLDRDYPSVTYDAVSVHNFPGLYDPLGYRAVGIFGPTTINNIFDAELSWWPAGEYRDSVSGGVEEVAGYVKDQIRDCPDEIIVLGGYSQGANVIGDSLFKFSEEEQEHIHAVALFGDPKYLGSSANKNTPFDYLNNLSTKPVAKPWKRGTASLIDRGYLDSRDPYVPTLLENRTLSWCFNDDFICTGGSGILQSMRPLVAQGDNNLNKDDLGAGHKRYINNGVPEAVDEIIRRLSPKLNRLEAARGGKDVSKSFIENTPVSPSDKPIDVMIMVNTSYGVDDVLGQLRSNTLSLLPPYSAFYSNTLYGIGEYSESGTTTYRIPRVSIWQQPTLNFDSLNRALNRKLAYGGLSGGGLDLEDPHQIGIERAIRATNWREGAEKHVVIITERPILNSITYNMCDSSVRTNFGIEESINCLSNPSIDAGSSFAHSERCRYVYELLTSDICTLHMSSGSTYSVQRTVNTLIELLEASDITVSLVVPHGFKSGTNILNAREKFNSLASVTGGLFLEYSEFNRANYSDMVWKILNNKPTRIKLKNIQDFDTANSIFSESGANTSLQLFTNTPQLFSIIGSKIYEYYSWDYDGDGLADEVTSSPQNQLIYQSAVDSKYLTVTANSSSSDSATIRVPISVVDIGSISTGTQPIAPAVVAVENNNAEIEVSWMCSSGDVIFIDLDLDGTPDYSAPCTLGSKVFNLTAVKSINAWTESYTGKSNVINVLVSQYIPPNNNDSGGGGGQGGGTDDSGSAQDSSGQNGAGGDAENQDNSNQDTGNSDNTSAIDDINQVDQGKEEDYSKNLLDIMKEFVNMLQQNQTETSGNNTNTYNPQKTKTLEQDSGSSEQRAATFGQTELAAEFDTTPPVSSVNDGATLINVGLFVVLPLAILYYRIYIRAKKWFSNIL